MGELGAGAQDSYRGRTYYMLLITFLGIVLVTILGSMYFMLVSLRAARKTSTEALDLAMRSYDLYLQNIKTSMSLSEMLEYLNGDGLTDRLRECETLPEGEPYEELMERLSWLHEANTDTDREYYLYFERSDSWVGSRYSMTQGRERSRWLMEQLKPEQIARQEEVTHRAFFLEKDGVPCMAQYDMIFPGVLLIDFGSAPKLPLPEELSDIFAGAEMYFIDVNDYAFPFQESRTLQGAFTYEEMDTGEDTHIFAREINGKPYRCYTHATYPGNLSFVFLSLDVAKQQQDAMVRSVLLCGGLLLAAAAAFCFWITNRIYRPVRQLMGMVAVKKPYTFRDEFQLLGAELSDLQDRIRAQNDLLRRVRLLRLLRGQEEPPADEAFLAGLPTAVYLYFAVAALRIDDCTEKENPAPEEKNPASLEALLTSYMKDCGICLATTQDSGFLLALVGLEQNDIEALQGALTAFKNLMESKEHLLISIYISAAHDSSQLPYSGYNEVLEVASYVNLIEEFNVIAGYPSVSASMGNSERGAEARRLLQLNRAIVLLNLERTLRLFDEIVEEIMKSDSLQLIRFRLRELRDQLVMSVYEAEKGSRGLAGESALAARLEAVDVASTAGLREALAVALTELKNEEGTAGEDNAAFREMLEFIQAHYRDPSFASSTVAQHFGISQSNVTRMFNRFNQTGFLEYLHSLRIAKARELLETTGYSVADISMMVGYTNTLTMTRAFKRYTGTTPGSFRKGR